MEKKMGKSWKCNMESSQNLQFEFFDKNRKIGGKWNIRNRNVLNKRKRATFDTHWFPQIEHF